MAGVLRLMHWEVTPCLLEISHIVAVQGLIQHDLVLLVLHLDLRLVEAELLKQF